ncbi:MAG: hypothetical protein ACSHWQ_07395, partial [Spongiibacteraceae bacterium]
YLKSDLTVNYASNATNLDVPVDFTVSGHEDLKDPTIPSFEIERMIDNSYALVVKGLKKSQRNYLELRYSAEQLFGPAAN